jgi:hypothetical protein
MIANVVPSFSDVTSREFGGSFRRSDNGFVLAARVVALLAVGPFGFADADELAVAEVEVGF